MKRCESCDTPVERLSNDGRCEPCQARLEVKREEDKRRERFFPKELDQPYKP